MDELDLVVVKTFLQRYEAQHAQGLLKSSHIDSIVQADDLAGFRPHLTFGTGNVRLLVKREQVGKAKEILSILEQVVPENDTEKAAMRSDGRDTFHEPPQHGPFPYKKLISNIILGILLLCGLVYIYNGQEPAWKDSFAQGSHFVIEVASSGNAQMDQANTENIRQIFEERLEGLGLKKRQRIVKVTGERTIAVQLPNAPSSDITQRFLFKVANIEFKVVEDDPVLLEAALGGDIPEGLELKYINANDEQEPVLVPEDAVLKGASIKDAVVELDDAFGMPYITLVFSKEGADAFAQITRENIGRRLAVILDAEVLSAPNIREAILGGHAQITGQFTAEEAQLLATALRAGSMPAEVRVLESAPLTRDLWLGK